MRQITWQRFSGEALGRDIWYEVQAVLQRENATGNELKACIGTDSRVCSKDTAFATVIVFLRKGKGGFMYLCTENTRKTMSIKQRMLEEVARSIDIAYGLCDLFTKYSVEMEVHADINTDPSFKSNTALSDAMGYILGMGFAFRAKPEAFASSSCADKILHL